MDDRQRCLVTVGGPLAAGFDFPWTISGSVDALELVIAPREPAPAGSS